MEQKKKKSPIRIAVDVILYVIIAVMVVVLALVLYSKKSGGETRLFGYRMEQVLTGSMVDTINPGEVFLAKKYEGIDSVKVGDIVTYKGTVKGVKNVNITHRIVEIKEPDANGTVYVITKGDANLFDDDPIEETLITDVFVKKMPVMTFFFKMIKKPWGFGAFIMIPLAILLTVEVVDFVKIYAKKDKEKLQAEISSEQDAQKELEEQIKKQLLEELNSKNDKDE